MLRFCRMLLVVLGCSVAATAIADWPAWRGPTGQGYCSEVNLPLKWSAKENVKWRIDLEHPGNSTPVIWGNRIFLTQANKGGTLRYLMCFDRANGKMLWRKDVEYPDKEQNWTPDWYANASPATDGERVIVTFGSAGVYCFDLEGKELWKRTDLGKWEHSFGNGSSPVLYGDMVIQWTGPNGGGKGRNDLMAFNKKTGETVWETKEKHGSWSTPLITKVKGQDQLLLAMHHDVKKAPEEKWGYLKGYDPKTGQELWRCLGANSFVYTSPIVANDIAVSMCGYGGSAFAVKLGGTGDITKDRLWLHPSNSQRVGSGIIVGNHVYILEDNGFPHCYELETGQEVWQVEKMEKRPLGSASSWSSMIHAEGKLYILAKNGDTHVLAASPKFEVLATNKLGEGTYSSIAVSNGELFIRTFKGLWCISDKK